MGTKAQSVANGVKGKQIVLSDVHWMYQMENLTENTMIHGTYVTINGIVHQMMNSTKKNFGNILESKI
jgi:hypothetical protein